MRIPSCFLVVGLFALSVHAAAQTPPALPTPLTLASAKTLALAQNPTIREAAARLSAAAARLAQARSTLAPTLDLDASVTHTEEVPGLRRADSQNYAAGLTFAWRLYDGMARQYTINAHNETVAATAELLADSRRSLLLAVAVAYYEALLARENMEIARSDAAFNTKLVDESKTKFSHGASTKSEVLNFEIKTAEAEANYLLAQLNYRISLFTLAELLAVDLTLFNENTVLSAVDSSWAEQPAPDQQGAMDYALDHRPDLRVIEYSIKAVREQLQARRADYLPTLSFQAGYGYSRDNSPGFRTLQDSAWLGLVLNWKLYSGNSTEAAVAEIGANLQEYLESLQALRNQILASVAIQHSNLTQAQKIAAIKVTTEKMAAEVRDLVKKEYDGGLVTLTRLNEVQTNLITAAGQRATAVIRYWQFRESLDAATARILAGFEPAR